jgi:hypothetical protein
MALHDRIKWKIIELWDSAESIASISRKLHLKKLTVRRWVDRYIKTGGVAKLSKPGRPTLLSRRARKEAVLLLLNSQHRGAQQVARVLKTEGLASTAVHRTTLARAAKEEAKKSIGRIHSVRGRPSSELSAQTKARRSKFASDNKNRRWDNVMFTDACKFYFWYPGASVTPTQWVLAGQKRRAPKVSHPLVVNLYTGITKTSVTKCHIVTGSSKHRSMYTNHAGQPSRGITKAEYRDVLRQSLLPGGRSIFGTQGVSTWYLQQDNAPPHTVAKSVIKDWNREHGSSIELLPNWPPNSPDLSPIVNFWSWAKARIDEKGCTTFEEFQSTLLGTIKGVPKSILAKYYNSMRTRMERTLELKGDKTTF